ncbi:AraC family transcriptional regulator [Enterococcus sp. HY326]|uniref:AraC family transcriptional regulator n=1 Tax=Enterococcus sp. HY326 TaxID=2971265 RepID=UPI00223F3CE5|nr:AraC family transcriptional regulator [Enterococcus sp. HY326]
MDRNLPINMDDSLEEHLLYQSVGFSIIPYIIEYDYERHDFMPLHWHRELQISWVFEGSLEFLIDGESVVITNKDILFINGNVFHSSSSPKGNAKTLCINFNLDFLNPKIIEEYIGPILANPNFSYYSLPMVGTFSKYFNIILNDIPTSETDSVKETSSTNYFQIINLINLILEEVVLHFDGDHASIKPEEFSILNKLLSYTHQNYTQKIMIKDLTDYAHISKTYCNSLFQKYTRMSPIQYVTAYRLQIAQELIITSNESISQISEKCGFGTMSYFVEQFRLQYNLSPLKFRKKFQL